MPLVALDMDHHQPIQEVEPRKYFLFVSLHLPPPITNLCKARSQKHTSFFPKPYPNPIPAFSSLLPLYSAFYITGQPPDSFSGFAYLNTPITYCNSTPYTLTLSARQLPPNSPANQKCELRAFTSFQGTILEIGGAGAGAGAGPQNDEFSYDGSWRRFGPVEFSIFRDNGEFNERDRTWNDTLSLIVQCFGVVGKEVPKEVVVEVDGVVIDKA